VTLLFDLLTSNNVRGTGKSNRK